MGFWHTGYAEFHEPSGLPEFNYRQPQRIRYTCEQCGRQFAAIEELRRHRFEQHPLRQPALLIRGRARDATPLVISTPLVPSDVGIEDTTTCLVNGVSVTPNELPELLARMSRQFVELELRNQGASTRCALDFRIAAEPDLAGVEAAFLRLARDRTLGIEAIARFIEDCRAFKTARLYCDGICHYLYGVLAKEQAPDTGLHQGQYKERYLRAQDELSGFDRPLANSIRSLVAFHFNHFEDAATLAAEGGLRHAARAFEGLLKGLPWHFELDRSAATGSAVEDLLTDQDTLEILADASHGLLELTTRTDVLQRHLRRAGMGYDRLKRALLTCEALAACQDTDSHVAARRLAREYLPQADTRVWAEAMLERLKTP